MCGLAGIVGRLGENNERALRRMAQSLRHRGPDAEGFWTSTPNEHGQGCLLAHRRLAIIDLSMSAKQPMVNHRKKQALVYNGEIYNFRALREELKQNGHEFATQSDTEVLLQAFGHFGASVLERLRGMFAFAAWDEERKQLFLARDPVGIKPLYFCINSEASPQSDWSLIFASELRAILASGLLEAPRLDPQAVKSMVWNGFVMGPNTAVRGVESLQPGQYRTFDLCSQASRVRKYWNIPDPPTNEWIDPAEVQAVLQDAVQARLVSDVPLGVFLSGGVDSSAVANLAERAAPGSVNTFTLSFEEKAYDESGYARAVANQIKSRHQEVVLTQDGFVRNLDVAMDSLDQPTFDGLNSYFVSRLVREAGFVVALAGTGGDELFGGYATFRDLYRWQFVSPLARLLPSGLRTRMAGAVTRLAYGSNNPVPPQLRWAKLDPMLQADGDLVRLYQLSYALFLPEFQQELLAQNESESMVDGLPIQVAEELRRLVRGRSRLSALSALELRCFVGERLLRDTDAASMAVSLEVRVPLLDHHFLGAVERLNPQKRYFPLGKKALLREIGLTGLDPAHFDRKKSGFLLPFEQWIKQSLGGVMDATLRDPQACRQVGLNEAAVSKLWSAYRSGAKGVYWSRVWALYVLMRWCQKHNLEL